MHFPAFFFPDQTIPINRYDDDDENRLKKNWETKKNTAEMYEEQEEG